MTGLFFMLKITTAGHKKTVLSFRTEVEAVRTKIILACTECKQRNYMTTKDKKTHPDRVEFMKYCKFCRKHTLHRETK